MDTSTDRVDRIKSIFEAALEFDRTTLREAYLDEACGQDPLLRKEITSLLQAHRQGDRFLSRALRSAPITDRSLDEGAQIGTQIGTQIGPYKIRERIGEGGMGEVYVAQQSEPVRRKVALKLIKPGMATKDVVARFEAERQALAMMDHPNIARVFDGGAIDSGQPYFVMELVPGPPLTEYCDQRQLRTRERLELFVKVCRAVQHAHVKGIIHRDLKPSNVLVPEIDGAAVPKVIDFGVAKAAHRKLTNDTIYTHFSQMVGTPLYMSPEQAGQGIVDIDTRSDVYSLGVLLYELLTGKTPFGGDQFKSASLDEMKRIIREEDPPRPSTMVSTLDAHAVSTVAVRRGSDPRRLRETLSGELDWIVMKCLEKDRGRRYESASVLAADLQNYLDGAPVLACPPSVSYRLRKLAFQHRKVMTLVASVMLALAAGLGVAWWQAAVAQGNAQQAAEIADQERTARQQAQANLQLAIEAVDDMYRELAMQWISSDKGLSEVQHAYLQKALDFYERLLKNPQQYQLTPHQSAEIAWRSAVILRKIDELSRAQEVLGDAVASYGEHVAGIESPSGEVLKLLTDLHNLAGVMAEDTSDLEAASESFANARAAVNRLIERPSMATAGKLQLAMILNNLATVHERQAEWELAEKIRREVLAIYDEVGRADLGRHGAEANYFGSQANLSSLLLQTGQVAAAEETAQQALRRVNLRLAIDGADDHQLRQVQILLSEKVAHIYLRQQRLEEAAEMLEELLRRRVSLMSTGVDPPIYSYSQFLGQFDHYPGYEEPDKWSEWIRNVMVLALVKRALDEPVAAEVMLSRAYPVVRYLSTLYKDSDRPWHALDEANYWAVSAVVFEGRRPADAAAAAQLAAIRWQELLAVCPNLETSASTLLRGQPDFAWFVERFPDYDVRQPVVQDRLPEKVTDRPLVSRGRALISIECGEWKSALNYLTRGLEDATADSPYDLLTLSLTLARIERWDEAQKRFNEAEQILGPNADVEPIVAARRHQVAELLERQHQPSDEP